MYVTGSNDGHLFVCDAKVSNNFKVLGHLGTNGSIVFFFCFLSLHDSHSFTSRKCYSVDAIFEKFFLSGNLMSWLFT